MSTQTDPAGDAQSGPAPDWRYLFIRALGLLGSLVAEGRAMNKRAPGHFPPTLLDCAQGRLDYWWALLSVDKHRPTTPPDTQQPPPPDTHDPDRTSQ